MSKSVRIETDLIEELKGAPRIMKDGDITQLNDNEMLFAPYIRSASERYDVWGIRKYNIHKNKWSRYIPYPKRFISDNHVISYDSSNNSLCIYSQYQYKADITTLDLKTKRFKFQQQISSWGWGASCIANTNNGENHIISFEHPESGCLHVVWNNNDSTIKYLDNLPEITDEAAIIYIPKQNKLVLYVTSPA